MLIQGWMVNDFLGFQGGRLFEGWQLTESIGY